MTELNNVERNMTLSGRSAALRFDVVLANDLAPYFDLAAEKLSKIRWSRQGEIDLLRFAQLVGDDILP